VRSGLADAEDDPRLKAKTSLRLGCWGVENDRGRLRQSAQRRPTACIEGEAGRRDLNPGPRRMGN